MMLTTRDCDEDEEEGIRCLAHGIAHAGAALGHRRLATILGTISLDLATPAVAAVAAATPSRRPAG